MIELVAEQTGTCISVFIGRPPEGDSRKFFLRGIHCGTAGPNNLIWSAYDEDGFRQASAKFSSFIAHANSEFNLPRVRLKTFIDN